jgi:hypothetical protein
MKDYRGFRITTIHAIVGIGDDDEEGIPAIVSEDGLLPLIASDAVRLDQIKAMAQQVADETGRDFKVVRFSVREDVGVIKSRTKN